MPLTIEEVKTPSGLVSMRSTVSGVLTPEEAHRYVAAYAEDGPYHGMPNCGVLSPGCEIPAESRKILAGLKPHFWKVASVVVPNMGLRMVATFMVKIIGNKSIRIFSTEQEALGWMDTALKG